MLRMDIWLAKDVCAFRDPRDMTPQLMTAHRIKIGNGRHLAKNENETENLFIIS